MIVPLPHDVLLLLRPPPYFLIIVLGYCKFLRYTIYCFAVVCPVLTPKILFSFLSLWITCSYLYFRRYLRDGLSGELPIWMRYVPLPWHLDISIMAQFFCISRTIAKNTH